MAGSNIKRRIPANPITPHGAYYLLNGKKPNMAYRSYDDTSVYHLMGGMSIPDRHEYPESIQLKSLSGLIAPWAQIEQKGATQDGTTFIDALYDPIDADMTVIASGRTPESTAQLIRDWIAAWDAKEPGELSFFDHGSGRWWAPVRWTRNPVDKLRGGNFTIQEFTWPFKAEDAFWRTYDHTDEFRFTYGQLYSEFMNLNGWTIQYSGTGVSTVIASPQYTGILAGIFGDGDWEARWSNYIFDTNQNKVGRTAVLRRTGFSTSTDNQIAFMRFGSFPSWTVFDSAYNDINYVFPTFIVTHLPVGLIGLLMAAIFAAAMSTVSGELSALSTSTVIDFYRRWVRDDGDQAHLRWVSKLATLFWAVFASIVAIWASELGSLIEVVNRFGSFFYGSILGVFLLAIGWKRANSTGAFVGLLAGMGVVAWVTINTSIAFLWHNLIGAVVVFAVGMIVSEVTGPRKVGTNL